MEIIDASKGILIDKFNLDEEDKNKIYIPEGIANVDGLASIHNGLVKAGEDYYFVKYNFHINELIGSYLARKINFESAEYKMGYTINSFYAISIGLSINSLFVVSKSFFDENYNYIYAVEYQEAMSQTSLNKMDKIYCYKDKLDLFDTNIQNELLKLIAIDLRMGQIDRHRRNVMFKINKITGEISLAPGYDYGSSYLDIKSVREFYSNPFLKINKHSLCLKTLMIKHPVIKDYANILTNISMEEILADLEKENGIIFSESEESELIRLDKEFTRTLKRF